MTVRFSPKSPVRGRYSGLILFIISHLLVFLTAGCGDFATQSIEHNYLVHVRASEPAVHAQFEKLVKDFNQSVGQEILSYSRTESVSASLVKLIPGLESNTGKLGFGGRVVYTNTTAFKIKRSYSMQIELDRNYVEKRIPSITGSKSYNEVRLLFFHEVGHGLGFSHAPSPSDVMYEDLQGNKDFARFFEQIRNRPADK
jgi:hypothetical protein